MIRRAVTAACCLFALACLPTCGASNGDAPGDPGAAPASDEGLPDTPPVVPPSAAATADAKGLVDQLTAQFAKVRDRASAVQQRLAIEVSLRFLRKQLPAVAEGATATSVFDSVLAGQQAAVAALFERADAALQLPECKPVLESYVEALRTLLR